MHHANHWGGSFEINVESPTDDERSQIMDMDRGAYLRHQLDETRQGWLLCHQDTKKEKYVDLGCILCKEKLIKWVALAILIGIIVIGIPTIVIKSLPKHKARVSPPDEYAVALNKALLFFNAQKSGHLPKTNGVPWRGNSGLTDGLPHVKGGLVGGYYDSGDNIKFHYPMAFSMTLLSWSVIEYSHKYKAIGEYDHVRDIIKWGTDYLLLTFNSSASTIDHIFSQVGSGQIGSTSPDDHYCWQRPEDMDYSRLVLQTPSAADLASEMAASLAAASIVFRDETSYSKKLINGGTALYKFATDPSRQTTYSIGNPLIEPFYNSTGYWDELIWGASWMFYATGNYSYILSATGEFIPNGTQAFSPKHLWSVFSWDNKLPGAELLLTRFRIFLNPGYPYEDMLATYHRVTDLNMCSYLHRYKVFKWTKGGLIQLNYGRPRPLQYAVNAAFLASLYADYMNASNVPGWYCGPNYISSDDLRSFAASQVNYILGANPRNMSYVVGYGKNYPRHVHHRGASIPSGRVKYSCTGGWKWRDAGSPNPNIITGAMVGGPINLDAFSDVRTNQSYTEPTLAANAGLVAALVSLTSSGGGGIDKNTMFAGVSPIYTAVPPPPPWRP